MGKTHSVTIETYLGHRKHGKKTIILNEHLFPVHISDADASLMEKEHPQEYERLREYA